MPKKNNTTDPVELEKEAQEEAEAMASRSDEASADINDDEKAESALTAEEGADATATLPAEVAAIHDDNESAEAAAKSTKKAKAAPAKKVLRSAKYQKSKEQVEAGKLYKIAEAVELVKKLSYAKFDGGVELHLKLTQKKTKGSTESSKGIFHLPNGSGKDKKVILLDEAKIEDIAKTKKIDFDVALATPELMPKVARIAKILGPKGKMPDPKSGTVTTDPDKTIAEINSGKVEYRIDSTNNIHQLVGRVSWDDAKLIENIMAVFGSMQKSRIASAYLTATMAPSVAIDLSELK